jgi:hypothetical protein
MQGLKVKPIANNPGKTKARYDPATFSLILSQKTFNIKRKKQGV